MLHWHCHPLALASLPHCDGAVSHAAGVGSHVIALIAKALWPTSQRRRGPLRCCLPLHWPGRCPPAAFVALVASIALALVALSPATQWRRCSRCTGVVQFPVSRSSQTALTPCPPLAGHCSNIAAVAVESRLHCHRTAATALPSLQPSTPLQSRHRCIAVAPSWS